MYFFEIALLIALCRSVFCTVSKSTINSIFCVDISSTFFLPRERVLYEKFKKITKKKLFTPPFILLYQLSYLF